MLKAFNILTCYIFFCKTCNAASIQKAGYNVKKCLMTAKTATLLTKLFWAIMKTIEVS